VNDSFDREVVGKLLAEARAHGPLDPEREQALARTIGDGVDASSRLEHDRGIDADDRIVLEARARAGRDARDELVTAYLPLVVGIARRYRWAPVPMIESCRRGRSRCYVRRSGSTGGAVRGSARTRCGGSVTRCRTP
jgi:hypothetical protein